MIMITSKCFILLLLPSPVSCVWIDHSYQSVTRPLSSSSWSDAVILLWWWSWWRLGWEWFAIMILCLTSSELKISVLDTKVSLSSVLPYFLVSPPNTPNAIPPSPMSPCHHVTTAPYNHLFILHPHIVSVLVVVSGIRLKKSLLRFHLKLKRTFFALVNQSQFCFGQMSDRQALWISNKQKSQKKQESIVKANTRQVT